ncbi:pyrroloquinoline quinone biosynthesis peptide chaperone PqqD [Arenibacterium sp. CAU 1754]
MIGAEDILVLPRGVRLHQDRVRGGWVLLAPERALTLDETGHAILSEIDGERSFGAICDSLSQRYNAPIDAIMSDAREFLQTLRNRRFLEVQP